MCDQTEVQYLPGEVVWVKLRALWWPGLVQDYDSLPEEITCSLRKRPIATVKFFQEDSYEYVHKLDLIYHYNCSRKLEFIKKGLDLCRKKSADRPATMDFFPMDIVTAEERTGGDPNILQDKAFRPDEKPKYTSLFGEQKKFGKKKGKEDSPLKDKVARRKKLTSKLQAMGWLSRGITANIIYPSPDTPRIITHRRFLNKVRNPDAKSDYESRIMEQKCEDETSCLMDKEYQCVMCGYVTRRLNVIVLHFNSTHSLRTKNIFPSPSILKGGSLRNPLLKLKENRKSEGGKSSFFSKKRVSLKTRVEKLKKEESEVESSEEEAPKPLPIKKEKGKPGRKRKVKPEEKIEEDTPENTKKPKVLDTLLADWDEEDGDLNQNEDLEHEKSQLDGKDEEGEDEDGEAALNESGDKSSASLDNSTTSKSKEVFEFDPDEDDSIDFDLTPNVKGFGRRIPRVIESSKDKKGKNDSKKSSKDKSEKKDKAEDIDDFESLLAETSVPSLPVVPKSSTFSMDTEDDLEPKVDETSCKSVLKEQNDGVEESVKIGDDKRSKNSEPEVDLAVDSKNPPQEQEQSNTAKVTVQMIPDIASAGSNINVGERCIDASPSESKPSSGDHTYVSGNSARKRRRHLLPLEKNDSPSGMSVVDTDDDFMVEESPRKNKQPFLPQVEGSNVVLKPTPRRGRPPKKGRGGKVGRPSLASTRQLSSKSPPLSPKSPSARTSSMSPPPVPSPKSPPPHRSPKSPVAEQTHKSPPHRQSSKSPTLSPSRLGPKSPIHVVLSPGGPKSPQPLQSPISPRSPQPYQSPIHQGPKSPQGLQGPKSPQGIQGPKSPQGIQGPKSPQGLQGPKSPQGIVGSKSPQGLQSPKSPVHTLQSPKGLKTPTLFTPDAKTIRSPPRSLMKSPSGEVQALAGSKSPIKSPLPSPTSSQATLVSPSSPVRSTGSKIVLQTSPVKVSAGLKKIGTSGAVVVQSKPDLQPEACGIGKIIASTPTAIASGTPGTVKTIKVAVSGSSPMVVTKPGSTPRKVMIVQGKGGTQKIMVPTEASQQLLSNIGSGKKIIVMTKGSSGSPGKLVLTPQQQKILASGGKVTTSTGQTITSKGTVMSSVAKLVAAKPSTSTSVAGGVELSSEPPALIKTDGKKTYKIITTPQSKGGNILLNTSGGQILVPVSSIGASGSGVTTLSGSKQFILPVGAKQMKFLNTAGGPGQKVILHMKSSTAKAGLPASPKTVQPIVPKTVVQSISPKTIQTISPKLVQTISSKTIQSITPKGVLPITPKTSQPIQVTKLATTVQPVPQLTPIGSPKTPRMKQVKAPVAKPAKIPAQPKSPRKGVTLAKTIAPAGVATSSTNSTPVLLPATSPQKRNTGIVPNPNLKPIAPHAVTTKKISLASKPAPVETPTVSLPGTVQVMTSGIPGLDQIQTNLVSSVESSVAMTLPTSTQQLVTLPTEDGGQVMYLIDNNTLIGLDNANQGNLGNIILSFDNMGQPVASSASDFTFSTPSSGQDILAEALANTDLQSETGTELSLDASGLLSSHSSSMYPPTLSHGVLETSLTLNQPIMTPLEDLSGVSTLQPPPSTSAATSIELPTITVPDITISTSSYSSLPIPSATIQSTVFSEAQNVPTFTTTTSADGSVFIEAPTEGESYLTADSVYEQASEGASMPLLDG